MLQRATLSLCLVLLAGFLSACRSGDAPTPTPTAAPKATTPAATSAPATGTAVPPTQLPPTTTAAPPTRPAPTATLAPATQPPATATTVPATATTAPRAVVPPEDAASARLRVPQGFAVRLFARGLNAPRLMTIGPDGQLYVAERGAGTVIRLADTNGDGLADGREVLASGFNIPHGIEWFQGWLYVAQGDKVERIRDADGDGRFEAREVVTTNIPGPTGHVTRTVHFGPDGKMYVSAGSSSNNTPEQDPRRAAIQRFNPDGSIPADNPFANDADQRRRALWAEGLRNSIDFLFLDDGRLWANHNGSDGLGNDAPPEEIVIQVEKGKHYGWPYCYTPTLGRTPDGTKEVRDQRVPLARLGSCDEVAPALFTDLAHQAPIGMARYTKTQFPAAYQGNLFVAYHGSWNSSVPRDCKVQMIRVQDGQPVASEPFLTGFRDNANQDCAQAWGRPAGVAVGPGGELFVSDDKNGNVYRIVYVGG
ncbi:MAG: PQQ-dependent sugar dehydrogenase [Anaerolineae bacterium]|nr:PQQ-dependent sugar dehydrogenase [Anaerolineae bacterium]